MNAQSINCLIVPTGIGASIGGYAGDANPVCRDLASISDLLITHPNVVNGAALTDIAPNVLVVEGALLDLFFENKLALRPGVKHKIGVIVDSNISEKDKAITQNVVNAGRHFYGLDILDIEWTEEPMNCDLNEIGNAHTLLDASKRAVKKGATALALMAKLPDPPEAEASKNYVAGEGYDPIGLIEAKISHLVSRELMIPSAHAPILDPPLYETIHKEGVVHPRVAAEFIGLSFLPSVLKCLSKSPEIIPIEEALVGDIKVTDLDNLIVPYDSCNGVPMREAHRRGVKLISVKENKTVLNETAESLGLECELVENYESVICLIDPARAVFR